MFVRRGLPELSEALSRSYRPRFRPDGQRLSFPKDGRF